MHAAVTNIAMVAFFAVAVSSTSLAQTSSPPSSTPPAGAPPTAGYYPPPGYAMPLSDEQQPGYHKHDGVYLRVTLGVGYLHTSVRLMPAPDLGSSLTLSGYGPAMNLALGAAVARNLILLCQFSMTSAISPKMDRVGEVERLENNRELKFFSIGPGVAYYFDSLGLYLSGAVTLAWMEQNNGSSAKVQDPDQITDKGLGTDLMVGKEWWVSRNWGLGAASMLQLASMKSRKVDAHWFTTSLSFLFSATFN